MLVPSNRYFTKFFLTKRKHSDIKGVIYSGKKKSTFSVRKKEISYLPCRGQIIVAESSSSKRTRSFLLLLEIRPTGMLKF